MSDARVVFIGGGNMARSLVGGLVGADYPPGRIRVSDPAESRRADLAARFGVEVTADNASAVADADVVVLAVKPQGLRDVAVELSPAVATRRPLVVSVAAGVREHDIRRWLDYEGPVVRCMPNTPALLQSGVTALYPNAHTIAADRVRAEAILATAGEVLWLGDEALMDTVTALSGSGPAYFFLLMEALEAAGERRGLTEDQARLLATQTALGAARMAAADREGPGELRARVTSKGGTTAEALSVLERGGLNGLIDRAVDAAAMRATELGDDLGAS